MTMEGRSAVVTGGSKGIGASVARRLASLGAHVVVTARSEGPLSNLVAEIEAQGGKASAVACDVSDADSVSAMAETARAAAGQISMVVNSAGVSPTSPFQRVTEVEWNLAMGVNAWGPLLVTQAFLPAMLEAGWGRVVNVASVASYTGAPYITSYAASKHALLGMSRCLAAELRGTGVTVNCVCPGYVDTPMTRANAERVAAKTGRTPEEVLAKIVAAQPSGRLVTPDEVAHATLSFLADEAGAMNGASLVVDGGGHMP